MKRFKIRFLYFIIGIILCSALSFISFFKTDIRINRIADAFAKFVSKKPQFKIYLQIDRYNYLAGDQIWIKAYYLNASNHLPDTAEKIIYVDLISREGNSFATKIFKNRNGFSFGDFTLPDTLTEGTYQIRAFTNWMNNTDAEYIFTKDFEVRNPNRNKLYSLDYRLAKKFAKDVDDLDVQFFPEGGNLIAGIENLVAFKAVDKLGNPVNINGLAVDKSNFKNVNFSSVHDGMGSFTIFPQRNSQFKAKISYNKKNYVFTLPKVVEKGIGINANISSNEIITLFIKQFPINLTPEVIIIGQMRGKIYYSKIIALKDSASVEIQKSLFPSGILQLTVFDAESQPRAERLIFINHNDFPEVKLAATTYFDKDIQHSVLSFDINSSNKNSMSNAELSISVTAVNQFNTSKENNIRTNLLLTSDLKGSVHNPEYYFSNDNLNVTKAADCLMLTQGWRRFTWSEIFAPFPSEPKFQIEKYIGITGRVYKSFLDLPASEAKVSLTILNQYNDHFTTITDNNGRFEFPNLEYNDTIEVLLETFNENEKKKFLIDVDETTTPIIKRNTLYNTSFLEFVKMKKRKDLVTKPPHLNYQQNINDDGRFRLHSSADAVVKMDNSASYSSVFQALKGRVSGVNVSEGSTPAVQIRGISSLMLSNEPLYLVDGVPVDANMVSSMNPNDVEMIEVLKDPSKTGIYGIRGASGVIAIYTKRGYYVNLGELKFKMMGYHSPREFYVPKNKLEDPEKDGYKVSPTIFWAPSIHTSSEGKCKIDFKNIYFIKRMRVTLEGISKEGKPIFFDQVISI